MDFFKKYKLTPATVVKSVLIAIGVFLALLFVVSLKNSPMGGRVPGFSLSFPSGVPSRMPVYDMVNSYAVSEENSAPYAGKGMMNTLSIRNI